jgi:hypothetical protein
VHDVSSHVFISKWTAESVLKTAWPRTMKKNKKSFKRKWMVARYDRFTAVKILGCDVVGHHVSEDHAAYIFIRVPRL